MLINLNFIMNNILFTVIGMLVGAACVYGFFQIRGKERLKKVEQETEKKIEAAQKKIADIEHKATTAETRLREKVLDAKNKALEIIDEAKQEERKMRQQLEKQERAHQQALEEAFGQSTRIYLERPDAT